MTCLPLDDSWHALLVDTWQVPLLDAAALDAAAAEAERGQYPYTTPGAWDGDVADPVSLFAKMFGWNNPRTPRSRTGSTVGGFGGAASPRTDAVRI